MEVNRDKAVEVWSLLDANKSPNAIGQLHLESPALGTSQRTAERLQTVLVRRGLGESESDIAAALPGWTRKRVHAVVGWFEDWRASSGAQPAPSPGRGRVLVWANRGGAIYNSQTNLQSTNCLFFGNSATNSGGAIHNFQSQPQIRLATMWGNSAPSGGGFYNASSFPNISNSIIYNNTPDQIRDIPGSFTTVTYSNIQGGWAGNGNISANPLFADPVMGDFNLSAGSPCIDAGNNAAVPIEIKTDLAGNPRFVDDPDTKDTGLGASPLVDMGALEFQVLLACPWDLNADTNVGILDLLAVLSAWGTNPVGPPDFDGDGNVGILDLLTLLANWGPCR